MYLASTKLNCPSNKNLSITLYRNYSNMDLVSGVFVFVCVFIQKSASNDLSNGWNDKIDWKTLDDALAESETMKKPIMLVVHKSWCGACKALKPKFAESEEIEQLSSNFLMVNTLDDDEPKDPKYSPDGGYIPRILFLYEGKVQDDLYHEGGNPKYKYYYHSTDGILKTMKKALETLVLGANTHTSDEL